MCAISSNICATMLHTMSHARSHYTGRRGSTCLALRDMLASCVHHVLLQSLHLLLVLGRSVFQLTDALVQERHDLTIRRGLYGMSHPSAASLPTTHTPSTAGNSTDLCHNSLLVLLCAAYVCFDFRQPLHKEALDSGCCR